MKSKDSHNRKRVKGQWRSLQQDTGGEKVFTRSRSVTSHDASAAPGY